MLVVTLFYQQSIHVYQLNIQEDEIMDEDVIKEEEIKQDPPRTGGGTGGPQ